MHLDTHPDRKDPDESYLKYEDDLIANNFRRLNHLITGGFTARELGAELGCGLGLAGRLIAYAQEDCDAIRAGNPFSLLV